MLFKFIFKFEQLNPCLKIHCSVPVAPNPKLRIFPFLVFTLVFNKNELKFFEHFGFSVLLLPYFSRYYFAMIDCIADKGLGLEDFEDPEDFVEPGK